MIPILEIRLDTIQRNNHFITIISKFIVTYEYAFHPPHSPYGYWIDFDDIEVGLNFEVENILDLEDL